MTNYSSLSFPKSRFKLLIVRDFSKGCEKCAKYGFKKIKNAVRIVGISMSECNFLRATDENASVNV